MDSLKNDDAKVLDTSSNISLTNVQNEGKKKKPKGTKTPLTQQVEPLNVDVTSIEDECFGMLNLTKVDPPKRQWTHVKCLSPAQQNEDVWIRCHIYESRCKGSLGFLLLREETFTVQAVLDAKGELSSRPAIKWAASLPLESVIDIFGKVVVPDTPILSTTQTVEVHVKKIFCISKSCQELPFMLRDASRAEQDIEAMNGIHVNVDTRLDHRVLDLRTGTNHSIFFIQSSVGRLFREFLYKHDFVEIHTPKTISGAAEGGASVFTFSYFGNRSCLAQSPQLHKQMVVCADFPRVFEIGPVFRSENSNTHRHLCEFTGLDMEMTIQNDYMELVDMIDNLLKHIFSGLTQQCSESIKMVGLQYPSPPFEWKEETLKLTFSEAIHLLNEAGYTQVPDESIAMFDLSTPLEKTLGQLVKKKYNTDYFFLLKYPLAVRPFYTMPCIDNPDFSNSFDVFMRGEEIISGAQRIHDYDLLVERMEKANIPRDSISSYLDAFKLGVSPHGGCGIGLERVVMLFLGLDNIRKTSMFPRDPKRIKP